MAGLSDIPFLGAYRARQRANEMRPMEEIQQASQAMGLMGAIRKQQMDAQMRAEIEALGPNPASEALVGVYSRYAGPEAAMKTHQSHLDREAALKAATMNQDAQRQARLDQIELQGQQAIDRVREAERERRITKEEADRREAAMRETMIRLTASLRPPAPDKTPSGYRPTPTGELEPIPGGPADLKNQGVLNQDTATLQESQSALDRLATETNRLLNHPGLSKTTGLMSIVPLAGGLATVPGTDAANFKAGLDTLKSQIGFSVLQQMRNNSKTGGALGQVSDRENTLLQQNLAALDRAQSETEFKAALSRIMEYTEGAKGRLRNAYNIKHGGRQAPASPPAPPGQVPAFATEEEAIKSGVKGKVTIGGRPARID